MELRRYVPMRQQQVGGGQSVQRLTQRTGGQQPAVAQSGRVDNDDFDLPCQTIMLQPVIGNQDIAVRKLCQQFVGCCRSVGTGDNRALCYLCQQYGFVSCLLRQTGGQDAGDCFGAAAITTADNAGTVAVMLQLAGKPGDRWSFSAATDGDVADNDDGHGQRKRFFLLTAAADTGHSAKQGRQGQQTGCKQIAMLPE